MKEAPWKGAGTADPHVLRGPTPGTVLGEAAVDGPGNGNGAAIPAAAAEVEAGGGGARRNDPAGGADEPGPAKPHSMALIL